MSIDNSSSQADSSTIAEKSKLRTSLLPTTSMEGCLICQKSKRIPKSKSLEKLSNCETFQAGATLLNAAKVRKDQRVIVAIEHQDVVAIEVKHHRSCYASYTSQKTLDAILKSDKTESRKQRSEYDIVLEKLAVYITENVVSKMEIVTMKVLRERYLELLEELGIENKEYRTKKLKTKMAKKFGSLLHFWHPSNRAQPEIVYCDALPKGKLIEETYLENNEHR